MQPQLTRWLRRGALLTLAGGALLLAGRMHAHHAAEARAASHRPRTFAEPAIRPGAWHLGGAPELAARVMAEPSADQWVTRLRDAVCACSDAACANQVQHAFADHMAEMDLSSGDPAAQDQLMHEVTVCTAALIDAAAPG
jgi:hypothetical protein